MIRKNTARCQYSKTRVIVILKPVQLYFCKKKLTFCSRRSQKIIIKMHTGVEIQMCVCVCMCACDIILISECERECVCLSVSLAVSLTVSLPLIVFIVCYRGTYIEIIQKSTQTITTFFLIYATRTPNSTPRRRNSSRSPTRTSRWSSSSYRA